MRRSVSYGLLEVFGKDAIHGDTVHGLGKLIELIGFVLGGMNRQIEFFARQRVNRKVFVEQAAKRELWAWVADVAALSSSIEIVCISSIHRGQCLAELGFGGDGWMRIENGCIGCVGVLGRIGRIGCVGGFGRIRRIRSVGRGGCIGRSGCIGRI